MEPIKPSETNTKPPVKKLTKKQKERLWFHRWYGSELAKLTPAQRNDRYYKKGKGGRR